MNTGFSTYLYSPQKKKANLYEITYLKGFNKFSKPLIYMLTTYYKENNKSETGLLLKILIKTAKFLFQKTNGIFHFWNKRELQQFIKLLVMF